MMMGNLRGEITSVSTSSDDDNGETDDIVAAIGRTLGMCSVEDHSRLQVNVSPDEN